MSIRSRKNLRKIVDSTNMTAITQPSRPAHAFTFDAVNQETEYDPPDIGLPVDNTTIPAARTARC